MKKLRVLMVVTGLLTAACGGAPDAASPADLGTYKPGEEVTIRLDHDAYDCTDQLPYAIVQITNEGERRVLLEHSCLGIAGSGVDQFCTNGKVEIVTVTTCSDAIFCEETHLSKTVRWDQQEYVEIEE